MKVLVGTGRGDLLHSLAALGYDAHGCDVKPYWKERITTSADKFAVISLVPYRLPYEDETFDVVISTSVLEHAQNKEELFVEIRRVLKTGGFAMHLFPAKWYLPSEPHANAEYCAGGLSYWSNRAYRDLSLKIFGNFFAPMDFYVKNSDGGMAKLVRKMPFQRVGAWLAGQIRMNFIVVQKTQQASQS